MSLNQSFISDFSEYSGWSQRTKYKIQTELWLMYGEKFYGRHTAQHHLQWIQNSLLIIDLQSRPSCNISRWRRHRNVKVKVWVCKPDWSEQFIIILKSKTHANLNLHIVTCTLWQVVNNLKRYPLEIQHPRSENRLSNVLESITPDVVFFTENWLNSHIRKSDLFSALVQAAQERQDHNKWWGVPSAVKEEYGSEGLTELDSNCEFIWARLKLVGNGTVYLDAYYHNHVADAGSVMEFEISVSCACTIHNATVIVGGNLNFPGWNWECKGLETDIGTSNHNVLKDFRQQQFCPNWWRANQEDQHTGSH